MGVVESVPVTTKNTEARKNQRLAYATSAMQGWRKTMEDEHESLLHIDAKDDSSPAMFAVYDGHAGKEAATFVRERLSAMLAERWPFTDEQYEEAIKDVFLKTDRELQAISPLPSAGTTAVVALCRNDGQIYVANAGDSRCVLSSGGTCVPLSRDHKARSASEKERVESAGGLIKDNYIWVELKGRGKKLAISRSLGDFEYKRRSDLFPEDQIVTANPEISRYQITDEDEFMVLACDGIWDCMTSQAVVDFVRVSLAHGQPLTEVCERLVDFVVAPELGFTTGLDNVTVTIVAFLQGRSLADWTKWVGDRARTKHGYPTPSTIPLIYDEMTVARARERWAAHARTQRMIAEKLARTKSTNVSDDKPNALARWGRLFK